MPEDTKIANDRSEMGNVAMGVIRAAEVSIPIFHTAERNVSAEVVKLRTEFLAGKELSRADLNKLVAESAEGGGGNTNCNFC